MNANSSFSEKQNSAKSLGLLRASSYYYGRAKNVLAAQFILAVPGALFLSLLITSCPSAKVWGVLYSVTVALVDSLWLDRWQGRLRSLGAKTQEEFDTFLFGLKWRKLQVGARLAAEDLVGAFRKHPDSDATLKDWYPAIAGELPFPLGVLVCQRINVWWDSEVRRKLGYALLVLLFFSVFVIVALAVATKQPTDKLILSIVSPLLPVGLWCMREALRQFDASRKLDATKSAIVASWDEALQGKLEDSTATVTEFQAAIYDGRSRHPLVFNWIHRLFRPEGQETMHAMSERLVAEVRDRSPKPA